MIRWRLVVFAALVAAAPGARAAVIAADRQVDWSVAGYPGEVPRPATVVDVTQAPFGAKHDGTTNDQPALAAAIASLNGAPGVVYLPAGNYRITAGLSLPTGVVLRGESSQATWIRCDLANSGSTCFAIGGAATGTARAVTAGLGRGSTALTVADATGFAPGDWAEVRETNGAWDVKPATWATSVVGQLVRVTSVAGNVLGIERPLRTGLDPALSPQIQKVVPKTDVGIEDLGIERLNDPTPTAAGNNFSFSYAARCWVKGVESNKSVGSHVGVYTTSQLEITGCYFHDAFTYDGTSTRGYGVTLNNHSGECLVEGNVFSHLRHAMMVKTGANGNVFGFNYSRDPYRNGSGEYPADFPGDIAIHGHWPFANLFEGNIVSNIITDQTWGPAGPFNTMFRNRAEGYGMIVTPDSPSNDQNYVGNDVMKGKSNIVVNLYYGLPYNLNGSGHFAWGNDVSGSGVQPSGTGALADVSYYRAAASGFCELAPSWPSIGVPNALGAGTNRARQRWDAGGVMTYRQLRVDAGPGATLADGGTVVLAGQASGGRGALVVTWNPSAGLSDAHAVQPTAAPHTSVTYTLTATDANGCSRSDTVHVTVTGKVATPFLSPVAGSYEGLQHVTLSCATPDAVIHYTLDGTEPDEAAPTYFAPIPLAADAVVMARAFKIDFDPSDVAVAKYLIDVDECTLGTDNCDANATCTNTHGGFACACNPGFSGAGTAGTCADVDECADGTHDCDGAATCTNTPGGFTCACNAGYAGAGRAGTCVDVDECAIGAGANNCDAHAKCTNVPGSFACACSTGYTGAGTSGTCAPVCGDQVVVPPEECDDGNGDDTDACTNGCLTNPPGDRCFQAVTVAVGISYDADLAGTHASLPLVAPCGATGMLAGPDLFWSFPVAAGRQYEIRVTPASQAMLATVVLRSCVDGDCVGPARVAGAAGETVVQTFTADTDGTAIVQVVALTTGDTAFMFEAVEVLPTEPGGEAVPEGATDATDDVPMEAAAEPTPEGDDGPEAGSPDALADPATDLAVGGEAAEASVGDLAADPAADPVADPLTDVAGAPETATPEWPDEKPDGTTVDAATDPALDALAAEATPGDFGSINGPGSSGGCAATRGPGSVVAILLLLALLAAGTWRQKAACSPGRPGAATRT